MPRRKYHKHHKPDLPHNKDIKTCQGLYMCPRCGFYLHKGDEIYRSRDGTYVCSVCIIMERGKGKK